MTICFASSRFIFFRLIILPPDMYLLALPISSGIFGQRAPSLSGLSSVWRNDAIGFVDDDVNGYDDYNDPASVILTASQRRGTNDNMPNSCTRIVYSCWHRRLWCLKAIRQVGATEGLTEAKHQDRDQATYVET